MRYDIIIIYVLSVIGLMSIIYDVGCFIYDRLVERRMRKNYEKAQEWLGRWGA